MSDPCGEICGACIGACVGICYEVCTEAGGNALTNSSDGCNICFNITTIAITIIGITALTVGILMNTNVIPATTASLKSLEISLITIGAFLTFNSTCMCGSASKAHRI